MDKTYKRNLIIKIILSIVALGIVILAAFLLLNNNNKSNDAGKVTIHIVTDTESKKKEIGYQEAETLLIVLQREFTVETETYGDFIMVTKLDVLEPVGNAYIAFYINDEYALTGVADTAPVNGTIYKFIIETY